ncbi:MAG: hypothetical protein JO242_16685 [Streptosporangiaceae bacterium]|nr:hypothetical protein [Streptosporangiaceae bacterium]
MAGLSADRPSEVVLAARVAREFYLEGVSKVDIAGRLGISRFRVARLLDSAREAGMVRIEIGLPGGSLDAGLSAELCSAFGLQHAFVFNFPDDDQAALRRRVGEGAGQALMDLITPGDVLGMSWSRSLSGLAASLTQIPPCPIVQLTGAVPPPTAATCSTWFAAWPAWAAARPTSSTRRCCSTTRRRPGRCAGRATSRRPSPSCRR